MMYSNGSMGLCWKFISNDENRLLVDEVLEVFKGFAYYLHLGFRSQM